MTNKKKIVYISHPSGGLEENTRDIERCIELLYSKDNLFNDYIFLSPVHCFGFMYNTTEYYRGLSYCTDLLYHCDMMILIGDYSESKGCKEEKAICDKCGIPYIEVSDYEKLKGLVNQEELSKLLKEIYTNNK